MHRLEKIRRRVRRAGERRVIPPAAGLRHAGLYLTPTGEKLVATAAPGGRHLLYHPLVWAGQAWVADMPVSYVITEEGHILTRSGGPTGWRIEDLSDTGHTARESAR
jgi:hypothetical protein